MSATIRHHGRGVTIIGRSEMSESIFNILVEEALAQEFSGWDFSWLRGHWYEEDPPWACEDMVKE